MNAVLVVDLETGRLALFDHFVNPCRTIALGRLGPEGQIYRNGKPGSFNLR